MTNALKTLEKEVSTWVVKTSQSNWELVKNSSEWRHAWENLTLAKNTKNKKEKAAHLWVAAHWWNRQIKN